MSNEKPDVTWISDSSGINSCHINGTNLSFDDSLIGRLMFVGGEWKARLKDGTELPGEFASLYHARAGLIEHYRKRAEKNSRSYPRRAEAA